MNKIYRILAFGFCLLFLTNLSGQNENQYNELMTHSGKFYNVVGVLVIIFIGLMIYLLIIDRKVKKLENQIHSK